MSHKNSITENVINLEDHKEYKTLPYLVTRKIMKQEELEEITGYDRHKETAKENICDSIKNLKAREIIENFCPVLQWIPKYSARDNLMSDVVSGFTVAIMHIPQGEIREIIN
jgi:hypothetical protein